MRRTHRVHAAPLDMSNLVELATFVTKSRGKAKSGLSKATKYIATNTLKDIAIQVGYLDDDEIQVLGERYMEILRTGKYSNLKRIKEIESPLTLLAILGIAAYGAPV